MPQLSPTTTWYARCIKAHSSIPVPGAAAFLPNAAAVATLPAGVAGLAAALAAAVVGPPLPCVLAFAPLAMLVAADAALSLAFPTASFSALALAAAYAAA